MTKARLNIEIVYALPDDQTVSELTVDEGATVEDAIVQSGLLDKKFSDPALNIIKNKTPVGIYAERVGWQDLLQDGDRIEIYRPLQIDPMEARRARAKSQQEKKKTGKKNSSK